MSQATAKLKPSSVPDVTEQPSALLAVGFGDGLASPKRIQLSRKKGWRMPPNTLNVARPSRYGNPHLIGWCPVCGAEHTREEAVAEFEAMLRGDSKEAEKITTERIQGAMRGKNLACWCKLNERCHADVLLRLANDGQSSPTAADGNGGAERKR